MARRQPLAPRAGGLGKDGGSPGSQCVHSRIPMERLTFPALSRLTDLRESDAVRLTRGHQSHGKRFIGVSVWEASGSLSADSLGRGVGCHAEESQGFEVTTFISTAYLNNNPL